MQYKGPIVFRKNPENGLNFLIEENKYSGFNLYIMEDDRKLAVKNFHELEKAFQVAEITPVHRKLRDFIAI